MARSSGAATAQAVDDLVQEAQWPGSSPPESTKYLLSVVCGNSRLQWALHTGAAENFFPTLFWRTDPPILGAAHDNEVSELEYYIPDNVKDIVFGTKEDHEVREVKYTSKTAVMYRATQRIPALYIYVISTNPKHAQGLAKLFRNIPCNIYTLSADDFFGSDDSVIYKGMGVDRVANVAGAKFLAPQAPSFLVVDGGTAMTYTAATVSDNKMQLSGGIGPGLRMKFRSLFDYTGDFPYVDFDKLEAMIEQCEKDRQPLPLFMVGKEDDNKNKAAALERSIAGSALRESALLLCNIIPEWLSKCPKEIGKELPALFLTGGDSGIFAKLLQPEHSYVVETSDSNRALLEAGRPLPDDDTTGSTDDSNRRFRIVQNAHLIHFGIQSVLVANYIREKAKDTDELVRCQLLGQRIAVRDPTSKERSKCLYGTIISLFRKNTLNDDYYSVFYDESGAIDDLPVTTIYDALLRYAKAAEHSKVKAEVRKMRLANKVKDAEEAAKLLAEKSSSVKALIESRTNKKRPALPPATAVNVGGTVPEQQSAKKMKPNESASVLAAAEASTTTSPTKSAFDPQSYVGRRAAKYFDSELYYGLVREYTPPDQNEDGVDLWNILYDDGDYEDLERKELDECFALYKKNEAGDPKKK